MRQPLCLISAVLLLAVISGCSSRAQSSGPWVDAEYATMLTANIDDLKTRAEAGDSEAAALLGEAYMYMTRDVQSKIKCQPTDCYAPAMMWFRKAADAGNPHGAWGVAALYDIGKGAPLDPRQAAVWYEKAAEGGDVLAQFNLAYRYHNGTGIAPDPVKAKYWASKAASQGHPGAEYFMAGLLGDEALESGLDGATAQPLVEKSNYWLEKAATDGDSTAQSELGDRYRVGQWRDIDYDKALYWYRKSADQHDWNGQAQLGWMYYNGTGVAQDYAAARTWWETASPEFTPDATLGMGHLYEQGVGGLPQDNTQAVTYYTKAMKLGSPGGMTRLAEMLYDGRGIQKDVAQSRALLEQAAHTNYPAAEGRLAWYYHRGDDVPRDDITAYAWAKRAARWGNEDGDKLLGELDASLSAEDKHKASIIAASLVPGSWQ